MNQKSLLLKALAVAVLTLLIGLALMMIQSTIRERMAFRDEAVRSIAADSVRAQTMLGPVLVWPYSETYEEQEVLDAASNKTRTVQRSVARRLFVFPNELQITGGIDTDHRYRGIHKVLVYSGQHKFSGDFALPTADAFKREHANSRIDLGTPHVALAIEDVRGIRNIPKFNLDGKEYEFDHGAQLQAFKSGLHAALDGVVFKPQTTLRFKFALGLDGIEQLHIVPLARNNQVKLTSNWPHPQFGGRFLPAPNARTIDAKGFASTWNISSLASNAQQQFVQAEQGTDGAAKAGAAGVALERLDYFSVGFIEPVNIYSQSDRATKYGLLFVALTFVAFFMFELVKRLPIHPVQYGLVGMALALFFLLLVSLSEHVQFLTAYLAASGACIALLGFYLSHALRDWRRGMGFGAGLTLLYGTLFGLLSSESNALVMGSILLFGILAAIMVATRKVDWYQLGLGGGAERDGIGGVGGLGSAVP